MLSNASFLRLFMIEFRVRVFAVRRRYVSVPITSSAALRRMSGVASGLSLAASRQRCTNSRVYIRAKCVAVMPSGHRRAMSTAGFAAGPRPGGGSVCPRRAAVFARTL